MSRDFNVDLSKPNAMSTYEAFKTLTLNRVQNRGTIDVVTNDKGDVTKLKCAQHHFYSGSVVKPNNNLCQTLSRAVEAELERISQKLQSAIEDKAEVNSTKKDKLNGLLENFREKVMSTIHGQTDGTARTPRPLTREDIKGVISQVEILRSLSVDNLLEIGVDVLTDPKALQNISIAAGLKTEFKRGELGAKAPVIKNPILEGLRANHRVILAQVKKACKGKTCPQAFVHAINQFSLRTPVFKWDLDDSLKAEYKKIIQELKRDIAFFSPNKDESPALELRKTLWNRLKPHKSADGDYGDNVSKLVLELEDLVEKVTNLYFYRDPATEKVLEREVL